MDINKVLNHKKKWVLKPGQQYYKTKAMKQWEARKDHYIDFGLDRWLHRGLWPIRRKKWQIKGLLKP